MNIAAQAQTFISGLREGGRSKGLETFLVQKLPTIVMVFLVVLIGAKLAELSWRLVPVPAQSMNIAQQTSGRTPSNANRQQSQVSLAQISRLNLFGKAGVTQSKKIERKAPETRLNLTLHGVFVEENPEQGAAIIGTSGNKQKYYKVGATVMNGVKLQGVFDDRVVLLRNGQSEILRFPKVSNRGATDVSSARPRSSRSTSINKGATAASLSEYKEVFQKEPLKIFEHVRFVPVRSRDGLKGYRVLPQKNRKLYNKLGIRPSDLVTSVNGVNLTNDKEAMKLIQTMKDATSVQVDIVRNGQPQSLSFNLN
jgi:general secretion pathway protein C